MYRPRERQMDRLNHIDFYAVWPKIWYATNMNPILCTYYGMQTNFVEYNDTTVQLYKVYLCTCNMFERCDTCS